MAKVLWLALIALCGVHICEAVKDPDLWWHITVGKWIIAHLQLPPHELWNQFALNTPWRAYSWLAEILFAGTWLQFSDHGLLVLQILSSILLVAALSLAFARLAKDHFVGTMLGIFCACACVSHLTLRPQTFVWMLFAWLFPVVEEISQGKLNRKNITSLVLIFCLWANLHITTILGIVTAIAWLAPDSLSETRKWLGALKVGGLCFLGTLITPYYGAEWLTFISKTGHPLQHQAIAEFQPANVMQFATAFLLIGIIALIVIYSRQFTKALMPKLLLVGAFIFAALAVIKFLPFAMIVICALLARAWNAENSWGSLREAVGKLRGTYNYISGGGFAFLMLCLVALKVFGLWKEPIDLLLTPVKAYDFIEKYKLPQPVMMGFGQGGYAMFRQSDRAGNPIATVPIDGRTNVVPHEIWEAFMDAVTAKNTWRHYFERVNPGTVLWKVDSPLTSLLLLDPEWCEIYRSGSKEQGFALYIRKDLFESRKAEFDSEDCGKNPLLKARLE